MLFRSYGPVHHSGDLDGWRNFGLFAASFFGEFYARTFMGGKWKGWGGGLMSAINKLGITVRLRAVVGWKMRKVRRNDLQLVQSSYAAIEGQQIVGKVKSASGFFFGLIALQRSGWGIIKNLCAS